MKMRHHSEFTVNKLLQKLLLIVTTLATLVLAHTLYHRPGAADANGFVLFFAIMTLVFVVLEKRNYTVFFLLSTFTLVTAWRLSALAGYTTVAYIYLAAMIIIIGQFTETVWHDLHATRLYRHLNPFAWQITFVRLYIGCDLVPHFCEKLFAGSAVRAADVAYFASVNAPNPLYFVLLAGLIEFFGGLALSCGIFTRTAGIGLCVYFLVASLMGHHFSNGFIWASPAGGWEYPALCIALFLSFFLRGAGLFSVDGFLQQTYPLPRWVVGLMGKV